MPNKLLQLKRSLPVFSMLFLVNILSYFFHTGIDLTAEKRFTLSPATKELIEGITEPMTLTVYLKGDIPPGFKKLAGSAADVAESFRSISNGRFQVVFERPGEGLADSAKTLLFDSLQRKGINPTNVKAQSKQGEQSEETLVFPGAILSGASGTKGIDFLEGQSNLNGLESLNNAEALMEYKLARAVMLLQRPKVPVVGYLTGNGQPLDYRAYDLIENVLRKDHAFSILPIDSVAFIPEDFTALVIAKPLMAFNANQRLKIDQYIMHGGKVLWALDNLYASMDSLQRSSGSFVAFDLGLELDEQLFKYGVRINRDLVQDLECDKVPSVIGNVGDKPQIELLPWPYAPLLRNTTPHAISRNLDHVSSSFPQSIDTIAAPGIIKHILLTTSPYGRKLASPALVEWRSIRNEEDLKNFQLPNIPVAVLLEGNFASPFANRLPAEDLATMQQVYNRPFLPVSAAPNSMIVIADGDILLNPVSQEDGPLAMGMNNFTRQSFANRDFISNCLFYLTGGAAVLEARGKEYRLRVLDKEALEKNKGFWQAFALLAPMLFPLLLMGYTGWVRKRKYARPF
jgi:gliding-associated putative ABC transporter substrate-binding component GldG